MNVYLNKELSEQIRGDEVLRWVLRSDLAPIPRTLELIVKDGEKLKENQSLWTGREALEYQIIKIERLQPTSQVQGERAVASVKLTALLKSCAELAFRRKKAVIRSSSTIGQILKECGVKIPVVDEFQVAEFSCFMGGIPSTGIARCLQEENSCIVLKDKKIYVKRIPSLFTQELKDFAGQTETGNKIDSEFLMLHEVPVYFTIDEYGQPLRMQNIESNQSQQKEEIQSIQYMPRSTMAKMVNATKVLYTKKVLQSGMAQEINAGDLLNINGEKLVVITAAHVMEQGQTDGMTDSSTKLWLGAMSK